MKPRGTTTASIVCVLLLAWTSTAPAITILGTGAGSLANGKLVNGITWTDLTDPEGDATGNGTYLNGFVTATFNQGNGPPVTSPTENAHNLFENNVGGGGNKWCCSGPTQSVTYQFNGGTGYSFGAFTLTSGNDSVGRDPQAFTMLGSNDGSSYTPFYTYDIDINNGGAAIWNARNQTAFFDTSDGFTTTAPYEYVRVQFDRTVSGLQLNEIELLAPQGSAAPPNVIPPPGTQLGTGTGALRHNGINRLDLTDPENDGLPDADVNYNAIFTSTNEPGFGGGEFSFNVFDNQVGGGNAKWCCADPGTNGHQLTAEFPEAFVIDSITITSSNDSPQRDPTNFSIEGSNNGVDFTPIFSYDNANGSLWSARNQVVLLEAGPGKDYDTPAAYKYVRYNVQDTGSDHALGELEFFDSSVVAPPAFGVRMVQVGGGNGSTDNDINNTTEGIVIATEATGTGAFTASNGAVYNVTTFVEGTTNAVDYAGGGGSYPINYPYPDGRNNPGDDFVVGVEGALRIPAGTWTIAFGSDDGGVLDMTGIAFDSRFNSNTEDGPGQARYEGTRGHGWTGGTFTVGQMETASQMLAMMFERGGGDSFELAIAPGTQTGHNGNFQLLYNGANGWGVAPTADMLGQRVEVGGDNTIGTDQRVGVEQDVVMGALTGAMTIEVRQNRNETIQIAELQAFETGTGINKAVQSEGGVATATSWGWGGVPTRANDGNTDGNYGSGSVWHSNEGTGGTLMVTLASPTALDSVHIWGRTDCCQSRQDDFNLIVSDAGGNELFNEQVLGLGTSSGRNGNIPVEMAVSGEVYATLFDFDTYVFELGPEPSADMLEVPAPGAFTTILDVNNATLEIELLDGAMVSGSTWQILSADQFIGSFDEMIFPDLPPAMAFDTSNLLIDGTLTLETPEPSSLVLAGLGVLGLVLFARRRKKA